jgi:hypothetical protein
LIDESKRAGTCDLKSGVPSMMAKFAGTKDSKAEFEK